MELSQDDTDEELGIGSNEVLTGGIRMKTFSRDSEELETIFEKRHSDDDDEDDVMNWAEQKFGFEDDDSDKNENDMYPPFLFFVHSLFRIIK